MGAAARAEGATADASTGALRDIGIVYGVAVRVAKRRSWGGSRPPCQPV